MVLFSRAVDVLATDLRGLEVDRGLLSVSELWPGLGRASAATAAQSMAGYYWLRLRLAEYLSCHPQELRLVGRDRSDSAVLWPMTDLRFSFARTGWTAVLAVGFRSQLGVSVATVADEIPDAESVERTMAPAEQLLVGRSHDPMRAFRKLGTRKEALAKGLVAGEDFAMSEYDVSGVAPVTVAGLEITDLHLGNDLVAAVAAPVGKIINLIVDHSGRVPHLNPVAAAR